MDAIDVILSRRSTRKFTGKLVNDENLTKILKAGFSAPSAHNRQPWEFIVLKDEIMINEFSSKHSYAKMLPQAKCAIVVCGDNENQKATGFLVADCAAAIENMLLAAHALNLGAVWCGIYPVPDLLDMTKKLLGLPETIIPIGLVAIGYKAEEKEPRNNFDPKKIHYNKW